MRPLDSVDEDELALLEAAIAADGQAQLAEISLPAGCSAESTTITAVQIEQRVELFVPAELNYSGRQSFWTERLGAEPVAGVAKLIGVGASLRAALNALVPHMATNERGAGQLTELDAVAIRRPSQRSVSVDELRTGLEQNLRGQDQALSALAERVGVQLAKRSPRRPLSLLLVGPTGVGKTESIQRLAALLGELEREACHFHRIDMNEYAEASRASMLLGAPPGYIGYSDGGLLVDALTADGRAVVLFDEIEKAHPQVLQVLMNLMDAGRLSHPRGGGEPIDARSALLCFTSNAQAGALSKAICADDDNAAVDAKVRRALVSANFLPEFVGRLSACLHFSPLSDAAVIEIAALSIARVADEYDLQVDYIEPAVVQQVVDLADAGRFGARMIEYAVERLLAPLFAKHAGREAASLELRSAPLRLQERE